MNLITVSEAMKVTGHHKENSFNGYLWRVNNSLPVEHRVIRVSGRIDKDSLEAAVSLYARAYKSRKQRQQ